MPTDPHAPTDAPGGSVTRWLPGLQRGERAAVSALWERYFAHLVRIAEARLRGSAIRTRWAK
jgi:hypothetical protein